MPEQQAAAAAPEAQQDSFFTTAIRTVGIFIFAQFVMKQFIGGSTTQSTTTPQAGATPAVTTQVVNTPIPAWEDRPIGQLEGQYNAIPQNIAPIWAPDAIVDVQMYISDNIFLGPLSRVPTSSLVLDETNLILNNSKDTREIHATFPVPAAVQNNHTLFGHFFVSLTGQDADPHSPKYDPAKAYHFVHPLTQLLMKKKAKKTRNLLSNTKEDEAELGLEDAPDKTFALYYHPNFTMSFIPGGQMSYLQMHPAMRESVHLETTGARDASGQNGWYYPIIYMNSFWQLRKHMIEINSTVKELDLNIHLNHQSHWLYSIISAMDYGVKTNQQKIAAGETIPGGGDGSEMEMVKEIILDSNIYLLSTTVIVSILHSIFELLAFKNDVSHWRNKKDNVGVSVRTILANVFMKLIVFLYLIDQMESTSYVILASEGFGVAIEAWKITKTVDVRLRPTPQDSTEFPWRFLPYTVVFEDKHKLSETEAKTKEYDEIAFRYLFWVAIPLLGAYAVYSVIYQSHKSWYSFILTTLVGSVYAYGFLMMVPSLYINYRLQSVAHMPGRAMTYKFLNTFIDDLFAFTVKMPLLHRLATLRDDVIFFVYLYQCWRYKVDFTRVNEFGQGGDDEDTVEKTSNKPLTSPAGGKATEDDKIIEDLKEASKTTGRNAGSAKKRR